MTVRRKERRTFEVREDRLADLVREILRKDRVYRGTWEREDGRVFATIFKPSFLFQEAGVRISLKNAARENGPKTTVGVTVVSNIHTQVDPFGYFDRIIRDFFAALEHRVEDPEAPVTGRGLTGTWYDRWTIAILGGLVALFMVLPAILALLGFGGFALYLLFYPLGAVLGFVVAQLVASSQRRFGLPLTVPLAVIVFLSAGTLLVVMNRTVSELLVPGGGRSTTFGGGLAVGLVLWALMAMKPEGFEGQVSAQRDIRGIRGLLLGLRRGARNWLLGGPHFPGNLSLLVLTLLAGLPGVILSALILARGATAPVVFAFLLLAAGIVLLGTAETVPLGPRWATVAGRVIGMLGCPVFLVVALISA